MCYKNVGDICCVSFFGGGPVARKIKWAPGLPMQMITTASKVQLMLLQEFRLILNYFILIQKPKVTLVEQALFDDFNT